MATKKRGIGKILNFVAVVFSAVVVLGFFVFPVFTVTTESGLLGAKSTTKVTCLQMSQVGFKEDEEVSKMILKTENTEHAEALSVAFSMREGEKTATGFKVALVAGWLALGTALLTLVFALLSLFAKATSLNKWFALGLLISTFVALIGSILIANNATGISLGALVNSKTAIGAGAIIGVFCGVLACILVWLAGSKKYSK